MMMMMMKLAVTRKRV